MGIKNVSDGNDWFEFKVYSSIDDFDDDSFENYCAVYFVAKSRTIGSQFDYFYIYFGQTESLKDRFSEHNKQDCFDEHGYTRIGIYEENDEEKRLELEKNFIKKHNPPCNEKEKANEK